MANTPEKYKEKNNSTAKNEMDFVRQEVKRLLEKGIIKESKVEPR